MSDTQYSELDTEPEVSVSEEERIGAEVAFLDSVEDVIDDKILKGDQAKEELPEPEENIESRMADKIELEDATSDDQDDEKEAEAEPITGWQSEPSVKDQAVRFPETVREVETKTYVFDLSDKAQLDDYNKIKKTTRGPAPEYMISDYDRQFHNGAWYVYLTCSKIEYQIL